MGYHLAGFDEIVGIDIEPQPNYPFDFTQGDALDSLSVIATPEWQKIHGPFDLIHASPPCQAYSVQTVMHDRTQYPDLVAIVRMKLARTGSPWIIENVPGSPLQGYVQVCGSGLGMERIRRHRWFEASFPLMGAPCQHGITREPLGVTGHSENGRGYKERVMPHGLAARREAMGINWMDRDEMSEAVPPAFTRFIGEQFLAQVSTEV